MLLEAHRKTKKQRVVLVGAIILYLILLGIQIQYILSILPHVENKPHQNSKAQNINQSINIPITIINLTNLTNNTNQGTPKPSLIQPALDKNQTINNTQQKPEVSDKSWQQFNPNLKFSINKTQNLRESMQTQLYAPHNAGKRLEEIQSLKIQIGKYNQTANGIDYEKYGVFRYIQVGSTMDYSNISKVVNFKQLQQLLLDEISHEVLSFRYNQSVQLTPQQVSFANQQLEKQIMIKVQRMRTEQTNFAIQLVNNPKDPKTLLQQFHYYNKKYNISSNKQEIPICVFATGYKIFSKDKYKPFFESVERQNYTNFHIVYVDDMSPDNSAFEIFSYLDKMNSRLKNRIEIIHNLQHLGALANMYFWIKKYCNQDDIVIIVDADDSIVGSQAFQVLNSLYKNQNHWFVYTNYVHYNPYKKQHIRGPVSAPLNTSTLEYRTYLNIWVTSHLRTFRKKMFDAIPIQHIIQYRYNPDTGFAYPYPYTVSADRFQVYSCIELAGKDRIVYIRDFLYYYDSAVGMSNNCYRQHQRNDQFRSRIKTPLKRLPSINAPAEMVQNYSIPSHILENLRQKWQIYINCKKTNPK